LAFAPADCKRDDLNTRAGEFYAGDNVAAGMFIV